jgi:hypothetical protein
MQNISLEYMAGFFDGEGSIVISKRHFKHANGDRAPWFTLVVCLVNTHLPIIEAFRSRFADVESRKKLYRMDKYVSKPAKHGNRKCYVWHAASDVAEDFLKAVYPYLIVKKAEAELAFEFRNHVRKYQHAHRKHSTSIEGVSWLKSDLYAQIQAEREAMYYKMRVLKRPTFADYDGMVTNSEKPRCPDQLIAEGQPRAKQESMTPSVCNEQVSPSKEKVCSELHGNMQSAAETSAPGKLKLVK